MTKLSGGLDCAAGSKKKNNILDTNDWKIQVKSSVEVNLYAHNLQKR